MRDFGYATKDFVNLHLTGTIMAHFPSPLQLCQQLKVLFMEEINSTKIVPDFYRAMINCEV